MNWGIKKSLILMLRRIGLANAALFVVRQGLKLRALNPFHILARRDLLKRTGLTVMAGPFKGLKYVTDLKEAALESCLMGAYEKEIHPILESLKGESFARIINIGAAEGYYAIGLAMLNPKSRVVAYEMDLVKQASLREMVAKNGMQKRIEVLGRADFKDIDALVKQPGKSLLFLDIEGFEFDLLDPARIPGLARAHFLAELHDSHFENFGKDEALMKRFEKTHELTRVYQRPRTSADVPFPPRFFGFGYAAMLYERPARNYSWLYAKPRSVAGAKAAPKKAAPGNSASKAGARKASKKTKR